VTTVAALCVGGVATLALSQTGGSGGLPAQEIAKHSREAYAGLTSYSDSGTVTFEMPGQPATTTSFQTRLQRPNLYRIDWTQENGLAGAAWSAGSGDYLQIMPGNQANPAALGALIAAGQGNNSQPQKMFNMKAALARSTGLSGTASSTIPGAFFEQDLGDVFVAPVFSGRHPLQREPDARVGNVDCYVVSSVLDFSQIPDNGGKPGTAATTLWIGKQDWLIHQCRTKYVEKVDDSATSDQAIDAAIRKTLAIQKQPVTPEAVAAMRPQMRLIMKQVQGTIKSSFESGVVFIQTHENIVVNQRLSAADFVR